MPTETKPQTLDQIAYRYGTDKATCGHGYTPLYEQYLGRWRDEPITLLELGVWKGDSILTWWEYFQQGIIFGVDRNLRECLITKDERRYLYQCDQANADTLERIARGAGGFDVIIDDASHISSKTIASFGILFPFLRSGGLYVIEDLQTSYDVESYGEDEALANPNLSLAERPYTAMGFCKRLADEVNTSFFNPQFALNYPIESVHFHPNICFIRKK